MTWRCAGQTADGGATRGGTGRRRSFISEGPVWVHFGYGEGQERNCAACHEEFCRTGRPPQATKDCWKMEIHLGQVADPEWLVSALMSEAGRNRFLMGKYSVHPLPAGEPGASDRVLFMYFTSREQLEAFCERLVSIMRRYGKLTDPDWKPSVRRGCWHFEPVAGPWQTWDG